MSDECALHKATARAKAASQRVHGAAIAWRKHGIVENEDVAAAAHLAARLGTGDLFWCLVAAGMAREALQDIAFDIAHTGGAFLFLFVVDFCTCGARG